jgi:hypothetical protein
MENFGAQMCALNFGIARCRVVMCGKFWRAGVRTKFSIARCGMSGTCIILVHVVCTHIIMACVVCTVLAERRGILLVRVQCGYMLLRDILVNGAHGVLVRDGGVLNFGMVQRVECNVCIILVHDTKNCVQQLLVHEPKLCMVDIGVRHKNCAQQVLVHEPKLCAVDISAQHKSSAHQFLARKRSYPHWL